ncbi:MAG: PD40 domain-containing protein [Planctomycetes bacterium]|nr:PD40 domain-containing protein [Planctomycetota bacterium]
MFRMLGSFVIAAAFGAAASAQEPAAEIPGWIRALDDEDPARRAEAAARLEKAGEAARGALEEAAKSGPPEAQTSAVRLLAVLERAALYRKSEFAGAVRRLADLESGEPRVRLKAAREWAAEEGRKPAAVERMLAILAADPEGACGAGAARVLNLLLAPARADALWRESCNWHFGAPGNALDRVQAVFHDRVEMTDAARVRLEQVELPIASCKDPSGAAEALELWTQSAGVVARLEEGDARVHIAEGAEAAAAWREVWEALKGDGLALSRRGLAPLPDFQKPGALDEWLARLDDPDPDLARFARELLRDLPDARIPDVAARAAREDASPALRLFAGLLALRTSGWIVFRSDRESPNVGRVYAMRPDGSGVRKISGDLEGLMFPAVHAASRTVWLGVCGPPAQAGLYVADIEGREPPRRVSDAIGAPRVSPDGRWILLNWGPVGLQRVDAGSGKVTILDQRTGSDPVISPQGDRAAWFEAKGEALCIYDNAGQGSVARHVPPGKMQWITSVWFSGGGRVAVVVRDPAKEGEEGTGLRLMSLDVATGEWKTLAGPHTWMYVPSFSADGRKVSFCWKDEPSCQGDPAKIEILDLETGKSDLFPNPTGEHAELADRTSWSPDGKYFLFHRGGLVQRTFLRPVAGGEWEEFGRETFWASWIAGGACLADSLGEDIRIHMPGKGSVNLTESAASESTPVFVPQAR